MEKYREALKKIHEIATFTPRVDPSNPSMLGIVDLNQAIEEIWEIAAEMLAEEVANNPEMSEFPKLEDDIDPISQSTAEELIKLCKRTEEHYNVYENWEAPPRIDPDLLMFP